MLMLIALIGCDTQPMQADDTGTDTNDSTEAPAPSGGWEDSKPADEESREQAKLWFDLHVADGAGSVGYYRAGAHGLLCNIDYTATIEEDDTCSVCDDALRITVTGESGVNGDECDEIDLVGEVYSLGYAGEVVYQRAGGAWEVVEDGFIEWWQDTLSIEIYFYGAPNDATEGE